jgi:hypothetical protein
MDVSCRDFLLVAAAAGPGTALGGLAALGPAERLERLLRPAPNRPTRSEAERATRVLEMTL